MGYSKIKVPPEGAKVTMENGKIRVPDNPVIPFIEGDGAGIDIWTASRNVFNAAVDKAYNGEKKISWMEVYAGEKSNILYGPDTWIPDETIEAIKEFRIAIKGPIAVPSGSNIRSVGQTLTQRLDLYVCLRPVKYFPGTPSPVKRPQDVNMTIFRENTEDIYAGMEFEAGKPETNKLLELLEEYNLLQKIRFPETTSFGLKPVSKESVQRLVRAAINFATRTKAPTVTFVHTGNILKYTEGNFIKWGYELAKKEFYNETITFQDCGGNPPHGKILIKDVAADIFIQHTFIKPVEYNVLVTLNLNGDYISNALTAQIGFTGISPSANINYDRGYAIFEPTHGTAPKYAGLDKVNPSSVILSGAMMFQYMGWNEAARIIENAFEKSISQKVVTYDFARIMDGAREVKCSEFANTMIKNM